jgi:sec-independent protein translocase protein TatB
MANLGMADSLILMVMALVVFGPRRLPEIGRQIGKLMYEVRKASNDFKLQMEEELRSAEKADLRKKEEERQKMLELAAPAQSAETIEAVSPLSEAKPGESVPDRIGANLIESPYPEEGRYPSLDAPLAEPPAEEPYPRIQPSAAGEPLPAGNLAAQIELPAASEAGPEANSVANTGASSVTDELPAEARTDETAPAPEQVHHG